MPVVTSNGDEVVFTASEVKDFNSSGSYFFDLIKEYAIAQGGQTLQVWQALEGPRFGLTVLRSNAGAAAYLGIPVSTLASICDATVAAIWPKWEASTQFKDFQAARAQGLPLATPDC